ncbi:MFS transporter [Rhizosaccharibacter radicis]|uniref:MFS transporter n=1 Tax=Rhizosaccharibacter radicis TaxID=2782605 RepID=A0ABT1VVM2_9PROT|nr:MFS transporter [Acetobacteraceae bacterium KSS12]
MSAILTTAGNEGPGADTAARAGAVAVATRRLMPFLILMYMIAFLDRSNVGLAKQGLQADAGVGDAMFALGAGIFFVGYAIFEVPSNLVMHRFGTRVWMARIMVTWGIVSACTMFVTGGTSFLVIRLLLGLAEAGFFPGIILFLTHWFPARERARVLGLFYFGYPLALTIGNPLSGALLTLDGLGGLRGWQWMFLVEGLLAVVVGLLTLRILPERPAEVGWLAPEQKRALGEALEAEAAAKAGAGHVGLGASFRSPRLMHLVALYFLMQIGSYGVVFYLPQQVSDLMGVKIGLAVGVVSALPWLCAVAVTAFWPALAQRLHRPRLFLIICLLATAAGLAISAVAPATAAVAALCLAASGIISVQAIFWSFPTARFGGVAAAGAIALINAIGNLGGFVAPNIRSWADRSWHSPAAGLYAISLATIVAVALALFLPARGFGAAAAPASGSEGASRV